MTLFKWIESYDLRWIMEAYGQQASDLDCYDELRDIVERFEVMTPKQRKFILKILKSEAWKVVEVPEED